MANPVITPEMRVMASEVPDIGEDYGTALDIGAAADVFGSRLPWIVVGASLGESAQLGAYDRWPLIEDTRIVGEIRDDACGFTIHVDRINGNLISVAL